MNKLSLVLVCGGTIALALSLVMGWLGVPHIVRGQIKKNARLIKGRDTYNMWRGPSSVPLLRKFYVFNVSNPEEVEEGGKPRLTQSGPYTYQEFRLKVDVGAGERNHTFQYRNQELLYFLPQMSTGSEEDVFTVINVPLLVVAKLTSGLEDAEAIQRAVDAKFVEGGEGLFKTASFRDLLFDGVPVEKHVDLLQLHASNDTQMPPEFLSGKYALYGGNRTDEIYYEVNTGEEDYKDFGKIESRNNDTLLPWWKHDSCNSINGTDGTIFSPFLTHETLLKSYDAQLCRSQTFVFEKEIEFKGVAGLRFQPHPTLLMGPHSNPPNWCYCMEGDPKACERDGLISTAACSHGIPFLISFPHFYAAHHSFLEAVIGLDPTQDQHATFMDLEPTTGRVLAGARRFQVNVEVTQTPHMGTLAKVKTLAFPIFWSEEATQLTERHLLLFAQIKGIGEFVEDARWFFIGGSLVCVALGVFGGMLRRDKMEMGK